MIETSADPPLHMISRNIHQHGPPVPVISPMTCEGKEQTGVAKCRRIVFENRPILLSTLCIITIGISTTVGAGKIRISSRANIPVFVVDIVVDDDVGCS